MDQLREAVCVQLWVRSSVERIVSFKQLIPSAENVKMCARRTGECKEEVRGPKKEEEPQCQLLDTVLKLEPRIVLRRAEISENLHSAEQRESVSHHIKEEEGGEEVQCIKEEEEEFLLLKEEEQEEIIQVPSTGVHLKSEDEGQSEERRGAEPRSRNSSSDGKCNSGGLQTDGRDDDNDEQSDGDLTCHTASKCWKCSQCRKAFASMSNLKRHMKIHTGEKPFSCSVCGQRFSRNGTLKIHTRTHTGEKPFSCSFCGQRFTRKGDLKIHTRTHTGEKPFSCLVCGQRFIQKVHLNSHKRTHTGEKPFSCSVCGQRFIQKGHLNSHKRTHTGEKPFSCQVCGQRFSYKYQAQTHKCDGENSSDHKGSHAYVFVTI
ncbi:zinc finger protein 771-like isoform X2 [Syngnathoides biaculeatus]|uniref:zinc finger protein 771-like isoform X2 n=1 Tax=Syngnathoides biaculeatus TaxID=300417 RepID=UPI002ADDD7F8|nr:zinc finger protein 771-like isoform X2 [Syngnathoides biaculeatus]